MSSTAATPPADATRHRAAERRPRRERPSTLTAYRWELRKLVSQKRTYMGLGLAVILPLIFVIVQNVHQHQGHEAATASSPPRSPSRGLRPRC